MYTTMRTEPSGNFAVIYVLYYNNSILSDEWFTKNNVELALISSTQVFIVTIIM
jgi:hypothetical protein